MKKSSLDDLQFLKDEFPELLVRAVEVASAPQLSTQDEDYLDQIFGIEPESHRSVICPDCGASVAYSADLEFHNCSGDF